jgi:GT2 family glycosyltransferase
MIAAAPTETVPTVSVIVVSRGRSADLRLCLLGVSQLDYPEFEVVLVTDPDGVASARDLDFFEHLKVIPFNEPNISAARNLGIAAAAGEIVAFIDDDAVPEPTWLRYLCGGFAQADVSCTGGFVIGRNGISFQWRARYVDYLAQAEPIEVDAAQITRLTPTQSKAIKTEGTNMALRRDVIAQMGGFDPAFRFFLDETDVNMRLARAGHQTALAPMAQVHHGHKASAQRSAARMPRDLFEIGASLAVYLRKHAPESQHGARIVEFRAEQRRRLLRHMVAGSAEPRDVRRVMATLDRGLKEGATRTLTRLAELPRATEGFRPMPARFTGKHEVLFGRVWQIAALRRKAKRLVDQGNRCSLFLFSPSLRRHQVRFCEDGYWEQRGGLWGRSLRSRSGWYGASFRARAAAELNRIGRFRGVVTTSD